MQNNKQIQKAKPPQESAPYNPAPAVAYNPLGLPQPQEWNQIKEICNAAVKSGMLPSSIRTADAAAIIALKARELGIPLMMGFANIHVINGKPAMSAELIQAQARKNLPGLIFNILETSEKICVVQAQRPERGSLPVKVSFSIQDAQKANLLNKDVWKQYPAAMLRARAITACLRIVCPDALMGVSHTPEELGNDSDAIPTTSRPVSENEKVVEAIPAPASPQEEPKVEDDTLKQKRASIWKMWTLARGTPEGFKRYIDIHFNVQSGQDLTAENCESIEAYVSERLNSRPPMPVDPEEPKAAEPGAFDSFGNDPIA